MQSSSKPLAMPVSTAESLDRLVACAHLTDLGAARWLDRTARHHGMKVTAIRVKRWNGFQDKVFYLRRFLRDLPADRVVLYLDAYDVLINQSPYKIWSTYQELGEGVIFSGELNAYPSKYRVAYLEFFNPLPTNYRFLNSGSFIGPRDRLLEILECIPDKHIQAICQEGSDQAFYTEYYLQHRANSDLKIDHHCRLFQNFHFAPWHRFNLSKGVVFNQEFGHAPCVLHFSGRSFLDAEQNNVMPELTRRIVESESHDRMWHRCPLYRPMRQTDASIDPDTGLPHPDEMSESELRSFVVRP